MDTIGRETLADIRAACDIADIVSQYVTLTKSGSGYLKGLCPFHSEKTPSFTVTPAKGIYKCFGCGESGDVITFIMKIEGLEFVEAVKFLAQKANIEIKVSGEDEARMKRRRTLYDINRDAARYYYSVLTRDDKNDGIAYLRRRGLGDKLIRTYGLGFAQNAWDGLTKHLLGLGYAPDMLTELGLAVKNKSGGLYDRFRNRVMFPIIDISGNVIGFGGRTVSGEGAKYLNSPESPIFKKSENLFSLNFAKAQKSDTLILAEGYMDVISLYGAGFKNAAASLGTSLTAQQARLAARYFKKIAIAYDSDSAGRAASVKALNLFSDLSVEVKVLDLGDKKDPDEFIRAYGAGAFSKLFDSSKGYIDYALYELAQKNDIREPQGKVGFLRGAARILAEVQSSLERDVYTAKIANEYEVSREALEGEIRRIAKLNRRQAETKRKRELISPGPKKTAPPTPEQLILSILYDEPTLCGEIEGRLSPGDLKSETDAKILKYIIKAYEGGRLPDISEAHGELSADEVSYLASIVGNSFSDRKGTLFDLVSKLEEERLKAQSAEGGGSEAEWVKHLKKKKAGNSEKKDGDKYGRR
ncbi:MAG: DNA primase [Clostridia bacterium]|nr:DNA primase [Clostridia bacterium]